jgi:hypothetical protein
MKQHPGSAHLISYVICGGQIEIGTIYFPCSSFHLCLLIIPLPEPTLCQFVRIAVPLHYTPRNSRFVHAGAPFPCFSYHANVDYYIWNIKHLFWGIFISSAVHYKFILVSELNFWKYICNVRNEINLFHRYPLRHSATLTFVNRTYLVCRNNVHLDRGVVGCDKM